MEGSVLFADLSIAKGIKHKDFVKISGISRKERDFFYSGGCFIKASNLAGPINQSLRFVLRKIKKGQIEEIKRNVADTDRLLRDLQQINASIFVFQVLLSSHTLLEKSRWILFKRIKRMAVIN